METPTVIRQTEPVGPATYSHDLVPGSEVGWLSGGRNGDDLEPAEALVQQDPGEVSSDQPQLTVVVAGESQLGEQGGSGGTWDEVVTDGEMAGPTKEDVETHRSSVGSSMSERETDGGGADIQTEGRTLSKRIQEAMPQRPESSKPTGGKWAGRLRRHRQAPEQDTVAEDG